MKKKLAFHYFYAYWDDGAKEKYRVKEFCEANKCIFNQIDCETPEGVKESIKWGVKLLPQVIICADNKELFRIKGKNLLDKIVECFNKK